MAAALPIVSIAMEPAALLRHAPLNLGAHQHRPGLTIRSRHSPEHPNCDRRRGACRMLASWTPPLSGKHRGSSCAVLPQMQPVSAVLGVTTFVPTDSCGELLPSSLPSVSAATEQFPEFDGDDNNAKDDSPCVNEPKMTWVCDKLFEVFMIDKPTTTDWRRLLAFSREWSNIRLHFFKQCEERADAENDPETRHRILRLARKLKEVDEDVQRHDELLEELRASPTGIGEIVARRRKDFTKEFFVHLHTVEESYYENQSEQNALAKLKNTCFAAVQAYDTGKESIEALNVAELKFQDILDSPTVDAACKKIDTIAEKKELDSALMLMITKAWSAAKATDMMKDEVKDILFHLYKTAMSNMQRLIPKEVRILKYLLTIEDPEELMSALEDAFTPGIELEGDHVDMLYTTPWALHTSMQAVVDAYHFSREGTLIREARDLMSPKIIRRLEYLKNLVEKKFL